MSIVLAEKDGYTEEDLEKDDNLLKEKYMTLADRDIRQNGYKIHSTINKEIYDAYAKVQKTSHITDLTDQQNGYRSGNR